MKLKKNIEEAQNIARKNIRKLDKLIDSDESTFELKEETAYWEGVFEALYWVCGKREYGLDDFVNWKI